MQKLSFSFSKPKHLSKPNHDYLSIFDPDFVTSIIPDSDSDGPLVIPPIPNQWGPSRTEVPGPNDAVSAGMSGNANSAGNVLRCDLDGKEKGARRDGVCNVSYGLNLRGGDLAVNDNLPVGGVSNVSCGAGKEELSDGPLKGRERLSADGVFYRCLKRDLNSLPEDKGMEDYEDVPVEDFPKALLAGYGWYEGRGVGKNAILDVGIKEYARHPGKRGLGFTDEDAEKKKRRELRKKKGRDGKKCFVGKRVRIIRGSGAGLVGTVVVVKSGKGGDLVVLEVFKRKKILARVRARDVADIGSVEEDKCLKKLKELKIKKLKERKSTRELSSVHDRREDQNTRNRVDDRTEGSNGSHEVNWLRSNIRVRIISKELKSGTLYLEKGEVVDVIGPTSCDICLDKGGELIQGVDQELLQAAIPQGGGAVIVLHGKHKGVYGILVAKDMENGIAVVRDMNAGAFLKVHLKEIAEYVGDPTIIGY